MPAGMITYWKHKRFNDLLIMGRAELDPTKRRDIYVEMQQIVHNEGGVCLPLFQSDVMALSPTPRSARNSG